MTLEDKGNKYLQNIWNILTMLCCCAMSYPRMASVPDKCSLSVATWLNVWVCNVLEHCVKKLFVHLTSGLPLVRLTCPLARKDMFTEVRSLFQKLHWTHCTVLVHFDCNKLSAPGNKRFHTVIYWIFTQLLTLVLSGKCLVQIWADCSFVIFFNLSKQLSAYHCKLSHGCSFAYPCILPSEHSTVWPDLQTALLN
jgi:hypothetical protein